MKLLRSLNRYDISVTFLAQYAGLILYYPQLTLQSLREKIRELLGLFTYMSRVFTWAYVLVRDVKE